MGKITSAISSSIERFFGNAGESFTTWAANTFSKKSRRELLEHYNGLVYTCVNAIAEDFAKYEPIFYKLDNRSGKKNQYIHPFYKVLENPNPNLSKFDLLVGTQSFIELTGEAFWYYALGEQSRQPKEIYLMRPDRMKIAIDESTGDVKGYTFRSDAGTEVPLDVDEVEHIHTFNPLNQYRGIGTLEAALLYVETENDTSLFQKNFMKNQATPSGVLTITGKITPEAFKKLKSQWQEKQAGLANVGKTLFIRESDAKFTKVGLSLGDFDMAALKTLTEDKIYKMFRMPKVVLGDTDQAGLGRANAETADYIFSKRNIDPKQIRLDDAIQRTLRRNYKEMATQVGHVSQVPEDRAAELNELDKLTGRVYTINEVRIKKGMARVDGGDELYIGFNQVPISESNTGNDNGSKSVKRVIRLAAHKDAAEDSFFRQLNKIDERSKKSYKKQNNKYLEEQRDAVIANLATHADKGITKDAYDDVTPNAEEEAEKANAALLLILLAAVQAGGETALKFLDNADDFQISEALQKRISEATMKVIREHTEQTIAKLKKSISEGVLNNESLEQLTARVNKIYKDAMTWRAERLADSESHKYVNKGLQEAYIQAGVKKKQWRALGGNPCKFCLSMDGKIIDVKSSYVPKGDSITAEDGSTYVNDYEDIENCNAHDNCNCWLYPVVD